MQQSRWVMACLALALTGVMVLAVPVFAQQGRGGGPQGQGNQWCMGGGGQGPGPGSAYCPNYQQGNQNNPSYGGDNTQTPRGRRGMRGGGRGNQPATQATPPAVTQ